MSYVVTQSQPKLCFLVIDLLKLTLNPWELKSFFLTFTFTLLILFFYPFLYFSLPHFSSFFFLLPKFFFLFFQLSHFFFSFPFSFFLLTSLFIALEWLLYFLKKWSQITTFKIPVIANLINFTAFESYQLPFRKDLTVKWSKSSISNNSVFCLHTVKYKNSSISNISV